MSKRILGMIALFTFAFMAGSVICLVSGQANAMHDCGNGMESATMCPFMSISIPAVFDVSAMMRVFASLAMLVLVAGFSFVTLHNNDRTARRLVFMRDRMRDMAIGRRSNVILSLLSDGVLHPRVFGL